MEEVDSILIAQLREIGCDLDDDIVEISSLDSYQIIHCVSVCLRRLINDINVLDSIPDTHTIGPSMNMSIKYKLANQLSTCIQNIGYKSDIGYQTFLYSNEHEIRRLFLFLIEQISTDDDDKTGSQTANWIRGDILQKLKNIKLNIVWIPYSSYWDNVDVDDDLKYCPESDYYDSYDSRNNPNIIYGSMNLGFSIQSYISNTSSNKSLRKFFKRELYQNSNSLLPEKIVDILEWNNHFWKDNHSDTFQNQYKTDFFQSYLTICEAKQFNPINYHPTANISYSDNNYISDSLKSPEYDDSNSNESTKDEIYQTTLNKLKEELEHYNEQISKLRNDENELIQYEQEYQEKCKLFETSYKSKEELECAIENIKSSIEEIASTWEEMQKQLLEKLKIKNMQNMTQNEEQVEKIKKINTLKKSISSKLKEIQSKEWLIKELESKIPEQWPPSRGSYTRRIMEIIQNVKKQNDEIKKVVFETKSVQKDINNFNGKIERSFTIAEEVLFREAKQNEWNRKCYKSLALLQCTFSELLQAIYDIGVHLREIRKLEEMIENENNRKTSSNLTRINADLEQIHLENKELREKISNSTK